MGPRTSNLDWLDYKFDFTRWVARPLDYLTTDSCVSVRSSRYEARGKFGGQERYVRVARGVAESNSSFTSLNYSRNLGNTVYEKHLKDHKLGSLLFHSPNILLYPIPDSSIPLKDISKLSHLGKTRHLNSTQEQIMREWAVQHGKCVRQRTVRRETTKFKAGTSPLNMYRPADSAYPKDKIHLESPAQYCEERELDN